MQRGGDLKKLSRPLRFRLIHLLKIRNKDGFSPLQLAEKFKRYTAQHILQVYQAEALGDIEIDTALQQAESTGMLSSSLTSLSPNIFVFSPGPAT